VTIRQFAVEPVASLRTTRPLLLLAAFALAGGRQPARADWKPEKTESHGLALSLGLGTPYGGAGGQAAYWLQLHGSLFRVAAYGGLGVAAVESPGGVVVGWALGMLGSWGHKHRVLLDLSVSTLAVQSLSLHGEALNDQAVLGPSLAVGYEYMAFWGFFFRAELGVGYMVGEPILAASERVVPVLTLLGLGYKAW
jgi:hypothetical protein